MRIAHLVCSACCLALGAVALGQAPTPLVQLQAEALTNNPGLQAARQSWRAAQAAIAPAGALPDPQIQVQQMSVHIPAPFTGFNDNMMSYAGIGATQALPYPGKLKLRAAVAAGGAQAQEQRWKAACQQVLAQVADAYTSLAEARAVHAVLRQQQQALAQAEKLAELHYRTAQGTQADVLAAQLEQTRLLRDLDDNQEMQAAAQAELRALLNAPAGAAAITPEPLRETHLMDSDPEVQSALLQFDPVLAAQRARLQGTAKAVSLARKNFKPDFSASYLYEHTASGFPDRYMWTLRMSLPFFHRASRQEPELEQAIATHAATDDQYSGLQQRQRLRLTLALLEAHNDEQILAVDQQGELPQARASAASALTAYANGSADLNTYLTAWREELAIEQQYWHTLGAHETALATVTELTGVKHD
ncbi:MAG: TolC family protein [Terriglobales bacterium]